MRRREKRIVLWVFPVAAVLLTAIVFGTGILNKQKTWTDVPITFSKTSVSLEEGDAYGVIGSGPYYDLPVGIYRIKWQLDGDGENILTLSSSNDAEITPSEIHTAAGKWEDEAWFEVKEPAHSFSINVKFASGTWMEAYNFRLYSPMYTDHAFTFAAVMTGLCVLMTLYGRGALTRRRLAEITVLAMAVAFASLLCLQEDSPLAYDTHFHAARIMNLADGLRSGQLPVRIGGFSYNGYGALTSVFYPDLLLYPFALMILGGASMSYVINALVIAVNILTAACMWIAARRMLSSRDAALCATVLYVLSIYRLEDIYCRLMVGEMLAMAVLPLFILGLYETVLGEKKRWPVLVLGATLVFRSHMLSTLLCAGVAALFGIVFLKRIVQEGRAPEIAKACTATLLINLNQIIPFIQCFAGGVSSPAMQFGFAGSALSITELLLPGKYVGLALWAGAAAFVCADAPKLEQKNGRLLWLLFAMGLVSALLATELVPWSHVSKLTGGMIDTLQFSWRVLLLTAICFALCGGEGAARLVDGRGMQAALLTLTIAAMCAVPYISDMPPYEEKLEFGQGAKVYMIYPEYQMEGTDVNDTRSREVIIAGDVQMRAYEKEGTRITAQVNAAGDSTLTFPLFGFDGYAAELNGERIDWTRGENNRLTVAVPAGTQGEIHIWFEGRMLWRIADGISVISALSWIGYVLTRRKEGVGHGAY